MKWTSLKLFSLVHSFIFTNKVDAVNAINAIKTWEIFQMYTHLYFMCGYEQFGDGTCHFLYLELGSKPMLHLRGRGRVPLCTQSHIIVLLRYKENSFTLFMMGSESQLWYGLLNQEISLEVKAYLITKANSLTFPKNWAMERSKTEFHKFHGLTLPHFPSSRFKTAMIPTMFTGKRVKLLENSLESVIGGKKM